LRSPILAMPSGPRGWSGPVYHSPLLTARRASS
jgi:hypothetical protein